MLPYPQRTTPAIVRAASDVEELFNAGAFSRSVYHKLMVGIAYEFSENQEHDKAMKTLFRCEKTFFHEEIKEVMESDILFKEAVVRLVFNMIQCGYIPSGEENLLEKPGAQA